MEIYEVNYDKETVDSLISKRLSRGDLEGALLTVKRAILFFDEKTEYYALAAEISEKLELYEQTIDFWYKFLSVCSEAEKARGYNGLGAVYYCIGDDSVASYYFQEQLALNKDGVYKYNDVLMEFADDTFSERDDYYLAYPYEKADFSYLMDKCHQLITDKKFGEVLEKLSVVPPESRFYSEALSLKAIAHFVSDEKDKALEEIKEAVNADKNNIVAICNAIGMFASSDMSEESEKFLTLLESASTDEEDEIYKIAMVYCEVNNHEKAYEYAMKYLKENALNVNMLFMKGLITFNMKRFDEAKETFAYIYRLTENPIAEFYRDLSAVAGESYNSGEEIPEIYYTFDLPESERIRRLKLLDELVKGKAKCKKLPDSELIKWATYGKFLNSLNKQKKIVKLLENNGGIKAGSLLKEYLISVSVYDTVKLDILENFIYAGELKTVDCVFGNLYRRVIIPPSPLPKNANVIFKRAFAVAISRLSMVNCDLELVKDVTFELYCVLRSASEEIDEFGANALAAVIFKYTGSKKLSTKRELAAFFDTTVSDITGIEKIIKKLDDIEI